MKTYCMAALVMSFFGVQLAIGQESLPVPGPPPAPEAKMLSGLTGDSQLMSNAANPCCTRVWGSVDYLLWWVKDAPSNFPLVTTTTNFSTTAAGVPPGSLGRPDTVVLYGGSPINLGTFSGLHAVLGGWIDPEGTFGVEVGGFLLEQRTSLFSANGGTNGSPAIYLPAFRVDKNREGSFTIAEPLAGGGEGVTGNFTYASSLRFWGAEANGIFKLWQGQQGSVVLLGGFRYLDLQESLSLNGNLNDFVENIQDKIGMGFDTHNQFYGGQLGLKGQWNFGRWDVEATGKVALGVTHQNVSISGFDIQSGPGAFAPGYNTGFWYAQPSNIGSQSRNAFSVVPQVGLKVGYNILPNLRATVGYDFVYWSDVVRPGDQIDRRINYTQLPGLGPVTGPALPAPFFNTSSFWAQGLSFGLELKF